jgi:hypothetical protein
MPSFPAQQTAEPGPWLGPRDLLDTFALALAGTVAGAVGCVMA